LLTEHEDSRLEVISKHTFPVVKVEFDKRSSNKDPEIVELHDFIAVKGYKALGNKLSPEKVKQVTELDPLPEPEKPGAEETQENNVEGTSAEQSNAEIQAPEENENPQLNVKPQAKEVKESPKKEAPKTAERKSGKKEIVKSVAKEPVAQVVEAQKSKPVEQTNEKVQAKKEKPKLVEKAKPKSEPVKKADSNPKKKDGGDDDDVPPEGPVQITLEL